MAEKIACGLASQSIDALHHHLSKREYEIMCLLGAGKASKEIAKELHLSLSTISTYRSRVLAKMGFDNNAQLIHYVISHQLK